MRGVFHDRQQGGREGDIVVNTKDREHIPGRWVGLFLAALLAGSAAAQDDAVVARRDTELREEPGWTVSMESAGFRLETDSGSRRSLEVRIESRSGLQLPLIVAEGLEHRITVSGPPASAEVADGAESAVRLLCFGDLASRPELRAEGREAVFLGSDGNAVVSYRLVRLIDARGDEIEAKFAFVSSEIAPLVLEVVADTRGARFPLNVHLRLAHAAQLPIDRPSAPSVRPLSTKDKPLVAGGAASRDSVAAAPTNDLCAGAQEIPRGGPFPYLTAITSDVTDATTTGDPPAPSCQSNVARSIWYTFRPLTSAWYTISACGDGTGTTLDDTVIAVYTSSSGFCGGTYTEVFGGCDDDSCTSENLQSVIRDLPLFAGTEYFIVVWQWGGSGAPAPGNTAVQLEISQYVPPPPPVNDACAGAIVIPPGPYPVQSQSVEITSATRSGDPSLCVSSSHTVWYTFTPTQTGNYSITTCPVLAPGTTTNDTVLGVYASAGGCGGPFTSIGCNDQDSTCSGGTSRSTVSANLTAGTTYYIVAGSYGLDPPVPGGLQVAVSYNPPPANDSCTGTVPSLTLDRPALATLALAANDYQLSGSACFTGVGQTASTAAGRDEVFSFVAPTAGSYSFRAIETEGGGDLVLYVASSCPAAPASPATVGTCLGAANRNPYSSTFQATEEVACLSLSAGQTAYVFVDEKSNPGFGGGFTLEVNRCTRESEPNGSPAQANALACGIEGSINPAGDLDYFSLGSPAAGSRVFALADQLPGNTTDIRMRVTTSADTLEFDDDANDTPFGALSPDVEGRALTGAPSYLQIGPYSGTTAQEPYRLYSVVQPAGSGLGGSSATPEVEPNGPSAAQANAAGNMFFSGTLQSTADLDLYRFCAKEGDLIFVGIDGDPLRNNTPINPIGYLFDRNGQPLVTVDDPDQTSDATPVTGSLTATTPRSPAEGMTWRGRYTGAYYAGVAVSVATVPVPYGDYLLSISDNCRIGTQMASDLSVAMSASPDPVAARSTLAYTLTVANQGPDIALDPTVTVPVPANTSFLSAAPPSGWTCSLQTGAVNCTTACLASGDPQVLSVSVRVNQCAGTGTVISGVASVAGKFTDSVSGNNSAFATSNVVDDGTCDNANACTTGDACSGGACVGGPPPNCNDSNACTTDGCDPASGCTHTAIDCSDTNPCTDDGCNPGSGCTHVNNTALCDDGNGCTAGDVCSGEACAGAPIPAPGEIANLRLQADKKTFTWSSLPGGVPGTVYDMPRGLLAQLPVGSGAAETCAAPGTANSTAEDPMLPNAGQGFWYLVRGRHDCGTGSYGHQGVRGLPGAERVTAGCP